MDNPQLSLGHILYRESSYTARHTVEIGFVRGDSSWSSVILPFVGSIVHAILVGYDIGQTW